MGGGSPQVPALTAFAPVAWGYFRFSSSTKFPALINLEYALTKTEKWDVK